ncbi:hypothetical protein FHW89_004070 [Mucilaginibacter sp. SG564]|nr:hypothetical protein [Mucilaginibacter sp. SG564]
MPLKDLCRLTISKDFYNLLLYCPAAAKNKHYFDEY